MNDKRKRLLAALSLVMLMLLLLCFAKAWLGLLDGDGGGEYTYKMWLYDNGRDN